MMNEKSNIAEFMVSQLVEFFKGPRKCMQTTLREFLDDEFGLTVSEESLDNPGSYLRGTDPAGEVAILDSILAYLARKLPRFAIGNAASIRWKIQHGWNDVPTKRREKRVVISSPETKAEPVSTYEKRTDDEVGYDAAHQSEEVISDE